MTETNENKVGNETHAVHFHRMLREYRKTKHIGKYAPTSEGDARQYAHREAWAKISGREEY